MHARATAGTPRQARMGDGIETMCTGRTTASAHAEIELGGHRSTVGVEFVQPKRRVRPIQA
eukprot:6214117-Pleurochrysis_carterae.AAC.2